MGVYEKETEFLGHIVTTEGIFRTLRLLSQIHPQLRKNCQTHNTNIEKRFRYKF